MEMCKNGEKLNDFFGGRFHKRAFFICLIASVLLLGVSFVTPPMWIIDASVIAAVGELFGFASLGEIVAAIERGKTAKISKGNISLSIENKEEKDEIEK